MRRREVLGCRPEISLEDGPAMTDAWIEGQVAQSLDVTESPDAR
jgi:hypothetical protein